MYEISGHLAAELGSNVTSRRTASLTDFFFLSDFGGAMGSTAGLNSSRLIGRAAISDLNLW